MESAGGCVTSTSFIGLCVAPAANAEPCPNMTSRGLAFSLTVPVAVSFQSLTALGLTNSAAMAAQLYALQAYGSAVWIEAKGSANSAVQQIIIILYTPYVIMT